MTLEALRKLELLILQKNTDPGKKPVKSSKKKKEAKK